MLRCDVTTDRWPYHTAFRIARGVETKLVSVTVRLTVTDSAGRTATTTKSVQVCSSTNATTGACIF